MEVDVQKLKDFREERVLSQRELARMANLAQGTVWRIEKGFSEVHPQTIRKLAGVLGVEARELVKKEDQ
jgi:transcriptional regulator with XRE-family HTH domain